MLRIHGGRVLAVVLCIIGALMVIAAMRSPPAGEPGGLAAASGERHQRSPKPAPQPLAAVGDVFPARAEARPR